MSDTATSDQYALVLVHKVRRPDDEIRARAFFGFSDSFDDVCRRVLSLYELSDQFPVEVEVFRRIDGSELDVALLQQQVTSTGLNNG